MHHRQTLLHSTSQIHHNILRLNEKPLIYTLLFGNPNCSVPVYSKILMTTIIYISPVKRIDASLI